MDPETRLHFISLRRVSSGWQCYMKLFIQNRKGQKIAILIEEIKNPKGLVFVMHGLSANKEEAQIITLAKVFREKGFTTVLFDTTNTFGESDGDYEDATITNYYEDLEDVIEWAKTQSWYQEPFWLVGHSVGGMCTALYAENNIAKVKALAPISAVVSGNMLSEFYSEDVLRKWKETGYYIRKSESSPTGFKKLKWAFFEDGVKHDLLENASRLTMSTLLMAGENDLTPLKHQQILFDLLPGEKELHIIRGAEHTFREQKHLKEISAIFDKWIEKNL